jgi:hypothetical protein
MGRITGRKKNSLQEMKKIAKDVDKFRRHMQRFEGNKEKEKVNNT